MKRAGKPMMILSAEDDPDDQLLLKDALQQSHVATGFRFVEDGEELMDYLHRRGKYAGEADAPRPDLILLDLNMPKKDGYEAAREIKLDSKLRQIPIVVLTTSSRQHHVFRSYDSGASSFVTKPGAFEDFVSLVKDLIGYWSETVVLPDRCAQPESA
jgi:two-component system, response regulator